MHIGKSPSIQRLATSIELPQTVSTPNKAVFENEKLSLTVERLKKGSLVAEYNNKLADNTRGCTLVETNDIEEATKMLRILKEGIRVGTTTETII